MIRYTTNKGRNNKLTFRKSALLGYQSIENQKKKLKYNVHTKLANNWYVKP